MRTSTLSAHPSPPLPAFQPHGYLHVAGDFMSAHRAEIDALLRREAEQARRDSPLSQIIATDVDGIGGLLKLSASSACVAMPGPLRRYPRAIRRPGWRHAMRVDVGRLPGWNTWILVLLVIVLILLAWGFLVIA